MRYWSRRDLLSAGCGLPAFAAAACGAEEVWRTGAGTAPQPPREMRGAWIATVDNIDWPSRPGLPVEKQRVEMVNILNRLSGAGINAIFFQVRPAADALYPSEIEPWSDYLTGELGRAPDPEWDPLNFVICEARSRSMEVHAWFNPFRAHHPSSNSAISPNHVARRQPELVLEYGRHLWLDPGLDAVHDHSLSVILDVARRYDIDGVHLDDYFYPYKERDAAGKVIPFGDGRSYAAYRSRGGRLRLDDWRRDNVDRFVRRLNAEVHRVKPHLRFGVSPFGIWRPGHPRQIKGFDAYSEIYADALKWWQSGWVDYLAPQLYWKINATAQSYPVLLEWWAQKNRHGRHLWAGNYTSKVGMASAGWAPREIMDQVRLTRSQPGASGNIHFSAKPLYLNRERLAESLSGELYAKPALPPESPWLQGARPASPVVKVESDGGGLVLRFSPAGGTAAPRNWVIQRRFGGRWEPEILPGTAGEAALPTLRGGPLPDEIAVAGVGVTGATGPWMTARRPE